METSLDLFGLDPVLTVFLELSASLFLIPLIPDIISAAIDMTNCGTSLFLTLVLIIDGIYRAAGGNLLEGVLEGGLALTGSVTALVMCGPGPEEMVTKEVLEVVERLGLRF